MDEAHRGASEYATAIVRLSRALAITSFRARVIVDSAVRAYRQRGEELDFDRIVREANDERGQMLEWARDEAEILARELKEGAQDSMCTSRHPITRERCKFPIDQHSIKGHTDGVIAWPIQPNRDSRMAWALHSGKNRAARRGKR